MNLARFPRIRFAHLPTPLEYLPNLSKALERAGDLDQARRLHRNVHGRQQDPQTRVPARGSPRSSRGHRSDAGRDAIKSCPANRGMCRKNAHRLPHTARRSDRQDGPRLQRKRQRAPGLLAWCERRALRGQSGYERRTRQGRRKILKRRAQALSHSRRRIESHRRARLRECRHGTHRAGQ